MAGRFSEVQMLYYVGKDLFAMDRSVDGVRREQRESCARGYPAAELRGALGAGRAAHGGAKLRKWGVADYKSIFARAIGLNCMFAEAPPINVLAGEFVATISATPISCSPATKARHPSLALLLRTSSSSCIRRVSTRACSNASGWTSSYGRTSRSALWRPHFAWRVRAHCDSVGQRLDVGHASPCQAGFSAQNRQPISKR